MATAPDHDLPTLGPTSLWRFSGPRYWGTWIFHADRDPATLRLVERFLKRPAEELYHTARDRFEMTNLAEEPAHADERVRQPRHWLASVWAGCRMGQPFRVDVDDIHVDLAPRFQ